MALSSLLLRPWNISRLHNVEIPRVLCTLALRKFPTYHLGLLSITLKWLHMDSKVGVSNSNSIKLRLETLWWVRCKKCVVEFTAIFPYYCDI